MLLVPAPGVRSPQPEETQKGVGRPEMAFLFTAKVNSVPWDYKRKSQS